MPESLSRQLESALAALEDYQRRDVQKLIELCVDSDARTIPEMVAADTDYEDCLIEKVKAMHDGAYEIGWDGGWCTIVKGAAPNVGDTVRIYGRLGQRRRGWALNGHVVEYETPWEEFASRMAMLADHDRGRREHYVKVKADMERWIDELRGPYKDRIDRFRAERADFDINSGSYEVYPVLMAQRIDNWCSQHEGNEVEDFRDLDYAEQSKIVHAGQKDTYGISGHQFDSACGLAKAVRQGATV